MKLPEYQFDWLKIVDFKFWPKTEPVMFFASVSSTSIFSQWCIENYTFVFQAQKKELEIIRQNYRRNSIARTPSSAKRDAKTTKFDRPIEEDD